MIIASLRYSSHDHGINCSVTGRTVSRLVGRTNTDCLMRLLCSSRQASIYILSFPCVQCHFLLPNPVIFSRLSIVAFDLVSGAVSVPRGLVVLAELSAVSYLYRQRGCRRASRVPSRPSMSSVLHKALTVQTVINVQDFSGQLHHPLGQVLRWRYRCILIP